MVAREDPADPARYVGVAGVDLSGAVAIYRDGRRLRTTVPRILQRGDEIETDIDVIAVIRYPAGDVYIGGEPERGGGCGGNGVCFRGCR